VLCWKTDNRCANIASIHQLHFSGINLWSMVSRKNFPTILKENWWKYAILGVLDIEVNDMYKYSTLTSIQVSSFCSNIGSKANALLV